MQTLVTVIHWIACVLLVPVILVQAGKGAEVSSSLGGSSQTVFGSSGGATFLTRLTSGLAAIFMTTSLLLTVLGGESKRSLFEGVAVPATQGSAPSTSTGGAPASSMPSAKPSEAPAPQS
jgi:preprotein translocase subunit SecG